MSTLLPARPQTHVIQVARSMSKTLSSGGRGGSPHRVPKDNRGRLLSKSDAGRTARTSARPVPYPTKGEGSPLGRLSPVSRVGKATSASPESRPDSPTKKQIGKTSPLKPMPAPPQNAIDVVNKAVEQSHTQFVTSKPEAKPIENNKQTQITDIERKSDATSSVGNSSTVTSVVTKVGAPASAVSTPTPIPTVISPSAQADASVLPSPKLHSPFPDLKAPTASAAAAMPSSDPLAKTANTSPVVSELDPVSTTIQSTVTNDGSWSASQNGTPFPESTEEKVQRVIGLLEILVPKVQFLAEENVCLQKEVQTLLQEAERRRFLGTNSAQSPYIVSVQMRELISVHNLRKVAANIHSADGTALKVQATAQLKVNQFCRRLLSQAAINESFITEPRLTHDGRQVGHLQMLGEVGIHEGSTVFFSHGSK